MPMILHALAEHGCSRQELYFLNKKGRYKSLLQTHIIPPPQPTAASCQAHLEMTFS